MWSENGTCLGLLCPGHSVHQHWSSEQMGGRCGSGMRLGARKQQQNRSGSSMEAGEGAEQGHKPGTTQGCSH